MAESCCKNDNPQVQYEHDAAHQRLEKRKKPHLFRRCRDCDEVTFLYVSPRSIKHEAVKPLNESEFGRKISIRRGGR